MNTNTTLPVGTTMRWLHLRAEVILSTPKCVVARDKSGFLRSLHPANGEWRDHDGDVWKIEEPEPPTLTVGTVLKWWPYIDRTVIGAAPGFVLTVTADGDKYAMAWINRGWRTASYGGADASSDVPAWEVQP